MFFTRHASLVGAPSVALYTSGDTQFHARKKAISFPDSLLVFDSFNCSGLKTLVEGEVPVIVEAKNDTPLGRKIAQATACARKVSPHYGCVMASSYVQKRQLGCLKATEALTTT